VLPKNRGEKLSQLYQFLMGLCIYDTKGNNGCTL